MSADLRLSGRLLLAMFAALSVLLYDDISRMCRKFRHRFEDMTYKYYV